MIIDRINRAVLRWMRRRRGDPPEYGHVHHDEHSVRMIQNAVVVWDIPWSAIDRVTAFSNDEFIGNTMMLAIQGRESQQLVTERNPGWTEFTLALNQHLPGSVPFARWAPKVAFELAAQPFVVFERGP